MNEQLQPSEIEDIAADGPARGAGLKALTKKVFDSLISDFYGYSDYYNYGLWSDRTPDVRTACDNLMEAMLERVPEKKGRILDVGCGKGATTRHLLKYYDAGHINAIDLAEEKMSRCEVNAPGVDFRLMDAANLDFDDSSFDTVFSVEAAFHFNTRDQFLAESLRVLKPGGWLVVSDVLMTQRSEESYGTRHVDNYLEDAQAYFDLLVRSGFEDVDVTDITDQSATPYFLRVMEYWIKLYEQKKIKVGFFSMLMKNYLRALEGTKTYLIASARKPQSRTPSESE